MKKLLLIFFCLPLLGFGQLNFLTSIIEGTTLNDTINGIYEMSEEQYTIFSEYDIKNNTLNSQILDTATLDILENTTTCFDPVSNIIYGIQSQDYDEEETELGLLALDVSTGLFAIYPLDSLIHNYDNWINDTVVAWGYTEAIEMECWNNSVYFITSIIEGTTLNDTISGNWDMLTEDDYTVFSKYDVNTNTLNSQILAPNQEDGVTDEVKTCFDPVSNIIYGIQSGNFDEGDQELEFFGIDAIGWGAHHLFPVHSLIHDDNNWINDTVVAWEYTESIAMECWNNSVYFITSIVEGTTLNDTINGNWDMLTEHSYTIFSEYDINTYTLNSQILDTSVMDGFSESSSTCFDPLNNIIYGSKSGDFDEGDQELNLFAFDVSTGIPTVSFLDSLLHNDDGLVDTIGAPIPSVFDWKYTESIAMEFIYDLPSDSIMNITECNTYSWNGNAYDSSGTYIYTTKNSIFLDSIVTLNLTINKSNSSTDIQTHCDNYTWLDNNSYTKSNNTATMSYTNAAGCDSIVTLDLTINSVIASISQSGDNLSAVTTPIGLVANWYNIQIENGLTRIWLMEENTCSFSPTSDCTYFIEVIDNNGCIATDTINYGAKAARIGSFITSPNPTSGLINVKFENSKNQFVMFELISNNGSKLDEFITVDNNLNIDLSKYPSGSYYLYFNSENAVQGCRLEEVQKISTKIILNK